eukprot:12703317-Alexandrium_andersonii.AAC.1
MCSGCVCRKKVPAGARGKQQQLKPTETMGGKKRKRVGEDEIIGKEIPVAIQEELSKEVPTI